MTRTERILSRLPDCDDALRRLSDVLQVPPSCRRRACRQEGACQGGYRPPCYFEKREFFSDALRDRMAEHRHRCERQRDTVRAALRR